MSETRIADGRREAPRLAPIVIAVIIVLQILALGLVLFGRLVHPGAPAYDYWREAAITSLPFGFVTTVLLLKRPDNRVTWLFTGVTLAGALQMLFGQYGALSIRAGLDWTGEATAVWASELAQTTFLLFLLSLFLFFPNGRLLSRRWRPVAFLLVGGLLAGILLSAVEPGPLDLAPEVSNPYAVDGDAAWLSALESLSTVAAGVGLLGALAALAARLTRSAGIERQQLKWFVFVTIAAVTLLFASNLLVPELTEGPFGSALWALLPASVGVSAALAILRYRLYEIDVVINKTLVYVALTAILAAFYLGSIVFLQRVLPVGEDSDLAVAASTLAVAGLFQPLRRRVQAFIDRRFYRSRYDAAETLRAFSTHLRDQVDLEALGHELVTVVGNTMQPAHASLWLRTTGAIR